MLAIVQPDEITDEEESAFDAAVADPALIKTEAEARGVLHLLDGDIEDIRQQLAGAKIEASVCPLPDHRQKWVQSAASALGWKLRQRSAVGLRLAELAPAPAALVQERDPLIDKVVAKVVRNVNHRSEKVQLAELRVAQEEAIRTRKAEEAEAKIRNITASAARDRHRDKLFVKTVHKIFSADECQKVWDRAKADYPDHPCWGDSA
jgi:hypothetical protein